MLSGEGEVSVTVVATDGALPTSIYEYTVVALEDSGEMRMVWKVPGGSDG